MVSNNLNKYQGSKPPVGIGVALVRGPCLPPRSWQSGISQCGLFFLLFVFYPEIWRRLYIQQYILFSTKPSRRKGKEREKQEASLSLSLPFLAIGNSPPCIVAQGAEEEGSPPGGVGGEERRATQIMSRPVEG